MKFKAPDNMGGFTYNGAPITIPESRIVETTDLKMIEVMLSHGFTHADDIPTVVATAKALTLPWQVADDSAKQKVPSGVTKPGGTTTGIAKK